MTPLSLEADQNYPPQQTASAEIVRGMEAEDVRRFLSQDDNRVEEGRKDSSITSFARKMSTIVLREPGTLRHRRRSRRSARQGSGSRSAGAAKSRSKSISPLQNGQKLHIDVSKGGGIFFVKRKETFCEAIMSSALRKLQTMLGIPVTEEEAEERDEEGDTINPMKQLQELCAPHRHRPASLEALVTETGFTRDELRMLYRGFKTECPSGVLSEECFHYVYTSFFPGRDESYNGNICSYTHYIYSLLDKKGTGFITFDDFIRTLSVLVHGSDVDKYNWMFDLYDLNGDGYITREEMEDVVFSIFHLVDPTAFIDTTNFCAATRVSQIFSEIDPEHVGLISREKWLDFCQHSAKIFDSVRKMNNNEVLFKQREF